MEVPDVKHELQFATDRTDWYEQLRQQVVWDERMRARKTASFGVPYNYSGISYSAREMLPELQELVGRLQDVTGMHANNCLLNYYPDGAAKMGFHSDVTSFLRPGTGIAIVSLGATRRLTFRKKSQHHVTCDYVLAAGSLLYMSSELQEDWQHALLPDPEAGGRISLTFRDIVA